MLVRNHMSRGVISFAPETPCEEALQVFVRNKIRHAPVLREGRLIGIVSERDLLRHLPFPTGETGPRESDPEEPATVERAMTPRPFVISPNAHLDDAARLLFEQRVSCLPVVQAGELLGIVTAADLFRAYREITTSDGNRRICWIHYDGDPCFDPAAACVELGLRLTCLLTRRMPDGGETLMVRVLGDAASIEHLNRRAAPLGYILLDTKVEAPRRSA